MKYLNVYLWGIMFFFRGDQPDVDTMFLNWNKATISDIQTQMKSSKERRAWYEDKITSLISTDEFSVDSVVESSLRYTFLSHLKLYFPDFFDKYYIIEITRIGEIQRIYKFVLDMSDYNQMVLYGYQYKNDWESIGTIKEIKLDINAELNQIHKEVGKGINLEDIIVTEFEKNNIKSSKYFVHFTLAKECFVRDILSHYISLYYK
jgi:hypothetical protein